VDEAGHFLLMLQHALEDLRRTSELGLGGIDRLQFDPPATAQHVVVEPQRVLQLLLCLQLHPVGEAGKVLGLEVGGHGQIEISGEELVLDLLVESGLHRIVHCDLWMAERLAVAPHETRRG